MKIIIDSLFNIGTIDVGFEFDTTPPYRYECKCGHEFEARESNPRCFACKRVYYECNSCGNWFWLRSYNTRIKCYSCGSEI